MSIWDSFTKVVSDATETVTTTYNQVEKVVTDTGHKIHFANELSEDVFILVAPNKDWAMADLVIDAALASSTLSFALLAKSFGDFTLLLLQLAMYKATKDSDNESVRAGVKAFFKEFASCLPAQTVEKVFGQTKLNPVKYLSGSTYGALLNASNMSVIIVNQSLTKAAAFNTNSDWSWIVTEEGVVRAKYGKLWEEDRAAGFYSWGTDTLTGP